MTASFGVALCIVLIVHRDKWSPATLGVALRATGRWSFLLFWLAYSGSALATLFGARFRALAQQGRNLGLSFASAHLVHVGLVVYLLSSQANTSSPSKLIFLGVGVFWVYLLALLSIDRLAGLLGIQACRSVRALGLEYIALVFLFDFARTAFEGRLAHVLGYLPFLAMAVAGPLLRLAAAVKRLSVSRRFPATPP